MTDYTYNSETMERLYNELDEVHGYSPTWDTKHVYDEVSGKWTDVENPVHDTFSAGDVTFSWYHGANMKRPDMPLIVASWISNYRGDDWDEHERIIDADADSIVATIREAADGGYYDDPDAAYDAWKESQLH